MSSLSGSQPQVTGSPQAASLRSPGSALPTFEEATASILSGVQTTFADSQPSSLLILSGFQTAGPLPSILPLSSMPVTSSRGEAGIALHDHRDLVLSLPSNASELLAVSGHIEEVETTHVSVETHLVNPPYQGCTTLSGINSSL